MNSFNRIIEKQLTKEQLKKLWGMRLLKQLQGEQRLTQEQALDELLANCLSPEAYEEWKSEQL